MNKIKLSVSEAGVIIAIVAVGICSPISSSADTSEPVYVNDFSTRTSFDLPPGAAWTRFKYTPGIPLADNYVAMGLTATANGWYTRPYSWVPDQDGWTKSVASSLRLN